MKESAVDSHIILDCARLGDYLWRNNTGAANMVNPDTGKTSFVRFGLANESAQMNKIIKSSDRIGITTITITPDMVGQRIGVFTAIETKPSDWVFRHSDKRAVAQAAFHDIVLNAGGFAGFARNVEEYRKIVRK